MPSKFKESACSSWSKSSFLLLPVAMLMYQIGHETSIQPVVLIGFISIGHIPYAWFIGGAFNLMVWQIFIGLPNLNHAILTRTHEMN